jgi:hypothetical protein
MYYDTPLLIDRCAYISFPLWRWLNSLVTCVTPSFSGFRVGHAQHRVSPSLESILPHLLKIFSSVVTRKMPPRRDKRYYAKILKQSLTQRMLSSSSTTTRHRVTITGTMTQEVPRHSLRPQKQVVVEPLLDTPQEEEAVGVSADGTEDPANAIHDPKFLEEDQTQVSVASTYSRTADLEYLEDKAVTSRLSGDLASARNEFDGAQCEPVWKSSLQVRIRPVSPRSLPGMYSIHPDLQALFCAISPPDEVALGLDVGCREEILLKHRLLRGVTGERRHHPSVRPLIGRRPMLRSCGSSSHHDCTLEWCS